jgi:hypothetical protein
MGEFKDDEGRRPPRTPQHGGSWRRHQPRPGSVKPSDTTRESTMARAGTDLGKPSQEERQAADAIP